MVFIFFYLTSYKIFMGQASNTTFIPNVFFKCFMGGKRYVDPPFRLLGDMDGMPPGSASGHKETRALHSDAQHATVIEYKHECRVVRCGLPRQALETSDI